MNSLYQELLHQTNSNNPPLQNITNHNQKLYSQPPRPQQANSNNLVSQFLNSSNPQALIQNMVMSNPKMQNLMQIFQNSKMSPKQFFFQYAQQKGINPEQFINSLYQGGNT